MERNARKIEHIFDFLAFQTLSSRQLNNREFSLIILKYIQIQSVHYLALISGMFDLL